MIKKFFALFTLRTNFSRGKIQLSSVFPGMTNLEKDLLLTVFPDETYHERVLIDIFNPDLRVKQTDDFLIIGINSFNSLLSELINNSSSSNLH